MEEIFKDIPGYEGMYQVSNLGRVKSFKLKQEKLLKLTVGKAGYKIVALCKDKNSIKKTIHQLVAISFLGHIPSGHKLVIDHIDNDKLNNRVDNLHIVTQRFNSSKNDKIYSSKYRGVRWHKVAKKWVVQIYINGKNEHLGTFTDELEASEVYINKLRQI
jgi:hypothetical protein